MKRKKYFRKCYSDDGMAHIKFFVSVEVEMDRHDMNLEARSDIKEPDWR